MSLDVVEKVKQTSRAILFERFDRDDSNKPSLDTLLSTEWDRGVQEFSKRVEDPKDGLVVRSYNEFLEKFKPTLYQTVYTDGNGNAKFAYSTKFDPNATRVIDITEEPFYKMILNLYTSKGSSGTNNIDFVYEEIKKTLSPQSEYEEAQKLSRNLNYTYNKLVALEDANAPISEIRRYKKNLFELRKKTADKYKQGDVIGILPLALATTEKALTLSESTTGSSSGANGDAVSSPPSLCEPQFDENGDVTMVVKPLEEVNPVTVEGLPDSSSDRKLLCDYISNDFDETAPTSIRDSSFTKNLILSVYSGGSNLMNVGREQLLAQKDAYQKLYKEVQESFVTAVLNIVERLMGVKTFFDHATENGVLSQSNLLVTNCSVKDIVSDTTVKQRFEEYIDSINGTANTKLWFAIVPNVSTSTDGTTDDYQFDDDEDFEHLNSSSTTRSSNSTDGSSNNITTMDELKQMLSILSKQRIVTFFNPKTGEDSSFSKLSVDTIKSYKLDCDGVPNECKKYSVFCYPNFTILPKKEGSVEIGTKGTTDAKVTLDIDGVYVDSSYVACGLMVASQTPSILKKKGFDIDTAQNNACVRVDIEDAKYSRKFLTKMNRENLLNWTSNIKNEINSDSFGFCFCSDEVYYDSELVMNSYVYNTRTLKKDNNGSYSPIYKTLMENFIRAYFSVVYPKPCKEDYTQFVESIVNRYWLRPKSKSSANRLLLENETIEVNLEDELSPRLTVHLENRGEVIDEIDIDFK